MNKLFKLTALALVGASLMTMAACNKSSAKGIDKIKADGQIVMSTNAEFEPFEYKDGNEIVGIDIEISKKVAEKLGVKLKINDVAFDALINEIGSNKADFVAAGMSITPDREKNVAFSEPYFEATQSIIVKKDSSITKRADLNGKKVGVQIGTTSDVYCTNEDGKSDIKVGETVRFPKSMDAISDLIAGRLDAVVVDDFPANKFVTKNPNDIVKLSDALTVEKYAIVIAKGNTELQKVVNEVISEMKSNGEYDKLIEKYKSALEGE